MLSVVFAFVFVFAAEFSIPSTKSPCQRRGTHPGLVIIQKEGKGNCWETWGRSWPLAAPAEENLNKPSPRMTGIISLGLAAAIIYFFNFLNLIFFLSATFAFCLKGPDIETNID